MKKFSGLAIVLIAMLLTACASSRPRIIVPTGNGITPNGVVAPIANASSQNAWTEGTSVCVRKNFLEGDKGDYQARGNAITWRGWNRGLEDRGDALCLDTRQYVRTGKMLLQSSQCLQFTSGRKADGTPNWMNYNDGFLLQNQIYEAPNGAPNLAVYIDGDGIPHITNQFADMNGEPC